MQELDQTRWIHSKNKYFWVPFLSSNDCVLVKDWHLSSFCISHTGQGKWVNYTSFKSRKELPLLLRRWRVTFQGISSRKFYTQQGVNGKLQARSYEIITNSLTDLLSAQDLCKHQYTSAKIKNLLPTTSFLTNTHNLYLFSVEEYSLLPVFALCREIRDKRKTAHKENGLQCPYVKYTPLQNQHHTGTEKATNLSLKRKKI